MERVERLKTTIYIFSPGLDNIFADISAQLKRMGFHGKYEILRMNIDAGLPKNDVGVTVEITYREKPSAYMRPEDIGDGNRDLSEQIAFAG